MKDPANVLDICVDGLFSSSLQSPCWCLYTVSTDRIRTHSPPSEEANGCCSLMCHRGKKE